MKTLTLPTVAQNYIDRYLNLQLGGKSVVAPYYMNLKRAKDLRAMVGKGTPDEIEMEVQIWAKLRAKDLDTMTAEAIREFMMAEDIGIDCSGFVMHVMNVWHKSTTGRSIWRKMHIYNTDLLHKIAYFLKPVEKLGAEIITNLDNCDSIEIKDVKPGDLIRSKWKRKNSHHVLLVSKVTFDEKSQLPVLIDYVNSTEQYGETNGVRYGQIKIKDVTKKLQDQEWIDFDENKINHTLEGFMFDVQDNGLKRLKCMKNFV